MPAVWKLAAHVYYDARYRAGYWSDRARRRALSTWFYTRKSHFGVQYVRNRYVDRRYGGWCGGRFRSNFRDIGANAVQSIDYYALDALFDPRGGVAVAPDDVLVDVGCGKGRVLNFWIDRQLGREVIGLELEPEVAAWVSQRLARFPHVSIRTGNALETIPEHGTLFFLFNPFGAQILEPFKRRVREIAMRNPRVRIVYYYAKHANVFADDPEWHVERLANRPFYEGFVITYRGPTSTAIAASAQVTAARPEAIA